MSALASSVLSPMSPSKVSATSSQVIEINLINDLANLSSQLTPEQNISFQKMFYGVKPVAEKVLQNMGQTMKKNASDEEYLIDSPEAVRVIVPISAGEGKSTQNIAGSIVGAALCIGLIVGGIIFAVGNNNGDEGMSYGGKITMIVCGSILAAEVALVLCCCCCLCIGGGISAAASR